MENQKKSSEQEMIEKFAFMSGKKSSVEEMIESFRETAEEMECFSF